MCINVPCREKMADHVTASNVRASGVPGRCVTDLRVHGRALGCVGRYRSPFAGPAQAEIYAKPTLVIKLHFNLHFGPIRRTDGILQTSYLTVCQKKSHVNSTLIMMEQRL